MTYDEELALFIRISQALVDESELPERTARAHFELLQNITPKLYGPGDIYENCLPQPSNPRTFDALFSTFLQFEEQRGTDHEQWLDDFVGILSADTTLSSLYKNIIILWYNGFIDDHISPAYTYNDSLVWEAIQGNPPGIPGPYYGNWAYPPFKPIINPKEAT